MSRESMVFYRSFYEAVRDLPPEEFKKAVCALMDYGLDEVVPDSTGIEKTIYIMAKPQIDKNNKRYENGKNGGRPTNKTIEQRKESAEARHCQEYINWRDAVYARDGYTCMLCGAKEDLHAHHKKGFDDYPELRYEVANGITLCRKCHEQAHKKPSGNQVVTKREPNVNVNVNANVNDIKKESVKKKATAFFPPTRQEVADYVREKGYSNVDVERFIDYYTANGWMVGKNKMKDWKAAVRNWGRSELTTKPNNTKGNKFLNFEQREYDYDELEKKLLTTSVP